MMQKLGYIYLLLSMSLTVSAEECDVERGSLELFARSDLVCMGRVKHIFLANKTVDAKIQSIQKRPKNFETRGDLKFLIAERLMKLNETNPSDGCSSGFTVGKVALFFLKVRSNGQDIKYESINQKSVYSFNDMKKFSKNCNYLIACSVKDCNFKPPENCEWSEYDNINEEDSSSRENQKEPKETTITTGNQSPAGDEIIKNKSETEKPLQKSSKPPSTNEDTNEDKDKNHSTSLSTTLSSIFTAATVTLILVY